jgi:hypothetical protein
MTYDDVKELIARNALLEREAKDAKARMWEVGHENDRLIEARDELLKAIGVCVPSIRCFIEQNPGGLDAEFATKVLARVEAAVAKYGPPHQVSETPS